MEITDYLIIVKTKERVDIFNGIYLIIEYFSFNFIKRFYWLFTNKYEFATRSTKLLNSVHIFFFSFASFSSGLFFRLIKLANIVL